jgi:hypothetical protein
MLARFARDGRIRRESVPTTRLPDFLGSESFCLWTPANGSNRSLRFCWPPISPHPKDVGEAIGMARQRDSRRGRVAPPLAALYGYACHNNAGLTSIAQEAIESVRGNIGAAIVRRQTKRETGADSVE